MARTRREPSTSEPFPFDVADHAPSAPVRTTPRVVRLGRVRVPIAGAYRPWATLYRMPDHRVLVCLRLWQDGRPVRRVVELRTLRAYARQSGLRELEGALGVLLGEAP